MNLTIKVGRDAARLCRADRHHRQHHHARQGHPPRIPAERGRCVQRAEGQAQPGPHPEPRLLPGQSGDQADRRLGARPRRLGVERRGEADRPAVAVGRLFEPRAVRRPARRFPEQLHGQGPVGRRIGQLVALFEVDRSRVDRPLFPRQADPARRPAFPPGLQQLQLSSGTTATRPIRSSAPAAAEDRFPAQRILEFRHSLPAEQRQDHARQEHLLHRPDGLALPRLRPVQGRTLSVRRSRHAPDLACRLFDALRRYGRDPSDARPAAHLLPGFRGAGRRCSLPSNPGHATKYKSFGSWILSLHGEGGYIKPLQRSPGPGRDAIRITDRFFNSNIRGFDIRGIGPRVVRMPYNTDGTLNDLDVNNQDYTTPSAARLSTWPGSSWNCRSARASRALACGPPSTSMPARSGILRKPILTDIVAFCSRLPARPD